jgi:hypothetical protein
LREIACWHGCLVAKVEGVVVWPKDWYGGSVRGFAGMGGCRCYLSFICRD